MDFRILGPLEALEEGERVALGGSRQRALLAVFLLHANETLSTDRLIDELWGERPPTTAGKTVQVRISRLRKALTAGGDDSGGNGLLVTRDYGYELRLDPDRLDSHRFERLAAEGRGELAAGRPEAAVSALEGALSLWRGEPLGDLAYEPFAQLEIARLRDMRVVVREQLIDAKLALGGHSDVVGELEALIGENPLRERLRGQLMLALYRCERQADALQAYQDARRRLVEELGMSRDSASAISSGRSWRRIRRCSYRRWRRPSRRPCSGHPRPRPTVLPVCRRSIVSRPSRSRRPPRPQSGDGAVLRRDGLDRTRRGTRPRGAVRGDRIDTSKSCGRSSSAMAEPSRSSSEVRW